MEVGSKFLTKYNYEVQIIEFLSSGKIRVKFTIDGLTRDVTKKAIQNRTIKHCYYQANKELKECINFYIRRGDIIDTEYNKFCLLYEELYSKTENKKFKYLMIDEFRGYILVNKELWDWNVNYNAIKTYDFGGLKGKCTHSFLTKNANMFGKYYADNPELTPSKLFNTVDEAKDLYYFYKKIFTEDYILDAFITDTISKEYLFSLYYSSLTFRGSMSMVKRYSDGSESLDLTELLYTFEQPSYVDWLDLMTTKVSLIDSLDIEMNNLNDDSDNLELIF